MEAHSPVRAPTPGQLAVFYEGDSVVGSGWIGRTEAESYSSSARASRSATENF